MQNDIRRDQPERGIVGVGGGFDAGSPDRAGGASEGARTPEGKQEEQPRPAAPQDRALG
jgi:hypothetical protein